MMTTKKNIQTKNLSSQKLRMWKLLRKSSIKQKKLFENL
ncbi:hypothetical protein LBBP_03486 [Leptospira borgpetersenii serovar Ballum]|uniref:Uncharacterized protein n=1 Tax=Leptospira borgpetersenii serovar Ballum TaxID=280505 RepID=A0A0S2IVJ4_LEPBO|nr:hypothetical protein LBBP_03486 [Leptospira borgpetersenii serovar Ballum]